MMGAMQPSRRADRHRGVRRDRDEQFHDFVVSRRPRLLHTATLLTAGDTHLAEDLVQAALTKLYVAWPAFQRADNPDGYVRRVLVTTHASWRLVFLGLLPLIVLGAALVLSAGRLLAAPDSPPQASHSSRLCSTACQVGSAMWAS